MQITPRLDPQFEAILDDTPDRILALSGIGSKQTNFSTHFGDLMAGNGLAMADVSSDPNANVSHSTAATATQESSKPLLRLLGLERIFVSIREKEGKEAAERVVRRILDGGLYPSDLHLLYMPYCYNLSASMLMSAGLPFIPRTPSKPAKHADSFAQHALQLIIYASNHQSGAVALTGFFVAYAWYAKRENLTKKEMVQELQKFTYSINQPVRYSVQTPFVNLTLFDREYLREMYGDMVMPDGSTPNIEEVMSVQKLYAEWFVNHMTETGLVFTFPVLTASILLDKETKKPRDTEFVDWLTKTNAELGLINIYMSENASSLSSCCRLSNDINMLAELGYVNSFGAGGDGIGSVGVCTVNLPHVALLARREAERSGTDARDEFLALLPSYVADSQRVVNVRRDWVKENIAKGLLPLYNYNFMDLNSQYNTVGICGMYEAGYFLGLTGDIRGKYLPFAEGTLKAINTINLAKAKEDGLPYNMEQVPAENQAVKMAEKDRVLGLQSEFRLYSNQWVPLTAGVDVFTRIDLAGKLDRLCSGGAILHLTVDGKISAEVQRRLINFAAEKGVVYFAFNYVLSKCTACGYLGQGDVNTCPKCGVTGAIETYSRVVGFVTPVTNWHKERRNEFHLRERYSLDARQKDLARDHISDSVKTQTAPAAPEAPEAPVSGTSVSETAEIRKSEAKVA